MISKEMTDRERIEQEAATIKSREFNINLSDADMQHLWVKTGSVGMTPDELLKKFIGDLVDGTYSNGSDERMYANEWFDRCSFEYQYPQTLLCYLLKHEKLDNFLRIITLMEEYQEEDELICDMEEELTETWNDYLVGKKDEFLVSFEKEIDNIKEWDKRRKVMNEGVNL